MIVEYIRYTISPERRDAFIAAYDKATAPLLASPYCTSFDMCSAVEDPTQFILRLEWTSPEDHMQRFRGSAEFREFLGHVRPFFGDIEEMRHYERLMSAE